MSMGAEHGVTTDSSLSVFWSAAKAATPSLPDEPPGPDRVWGFGATAKHADELLELVLDGVKTGTAGYLDEYIAEGVAIEQVGDLDVILDGSGKPRAIIETTAVEVTPFNEVTEEHALSEGEDDRTLASWRRIHRDFYEEFVAPGTPFKADIPIVCQRFRLVYAAIIGED